MTQKNKPTKKSGDISSPKGMRDIVGDDYYKVQGLFEKAQEIAVYYGFKPIETPILEHEETFTSAIGVGTDVVDKEMYTLKTKGGDHLAMRPCKVSLNRSCSITPVRSFVMTNHKKVVIVSFTSLMSIY
jgi:hypothetical protein